MIYFLQFCLKRITSLGLGGKLRAAALLQTSDRPCTTLQSSDLQSRSCSAAGQLACSAEMHLRLSLKIREVCFFKAASSIPLHHTNTGAVAFHYDEINISAYFYPQCMSGIGWWRGGGSLQHKQVGKLGIQKQLLQNRGSNSNLARR